MLVGQAASLTTLGLWTQAELGSVQLAVSLTDMSIPPKRILGLDLDISGTNGEQF